MTVMKARIPVAKSTVQFELSFDGRTVANALHDPRPVTVDAVARYHDEVRMYRREGEPTRVYVNGRPIGFFDRFGTMLFARKPLRVPVVMLLLSDGQIVFVHEQALRVITQWHKLSGIDKRYPEKAMAFNVESPLRHGTISYAAARAAKLGDAVTHEYPFQWIHLKSRGRVLTNGIVTFPVKRPERAEWNDYPIDAVPAHRWDAFLDGLEGKFYRDMVAVAQNVRLEPETTRGPRLTPAQARFARVINGYMWKGNGGEQVELGRNVIFYVERTGKPTVYVVDGTGAAFLHDDVAYVRDIASGRVRRRQALRDGAQRIVHAGAWELRLVTAIAEF